MNRRKLVLALTSIFLFIAICAIIYLVNIYLGFRPSYYEIKKLDDIKKISIWLQSRNEETIIMSSKKDFKVIVAPKEIKQVIEKIKSLPNNNWQYDEFNPPNTPSMGKLNPILLVFYDANNKAKVVLSLGYSDKNIYTLQVIYGPGQYLSRTEFEEIIKVIGIDKELANCKRATPDCYTY